MAEGSERSLASLIDERDTERQPTSVIYWGDNLNVLGTLPRNSVDLIYLDPPFSFDRKYWDIWGEDDKGEQDKAVMKAYEEACSGGVYTYVKWMRDRVELMHRALKETGSLYFHCDWKMGHHFRVMLDQVFGVNKLGWCDKFQNEIIWWYGGGGASKTRFGRKHDNIFFYTKSNRGVHTFNVDEVREPYKEEWTRGQKRADGSERTLDKGKLPDDVLREHGIMPWAGEKTGYDTQKPESLIEKIVRASSNEGDIVLDPFCGCGTTPAVAYKLGRRWIGIDLAEKGCRTMKERLEKLGAPYCVVPWDLKIDNENLHERQVQYLEQQLSGNEFRDWVVLRIHGLPKRGTDGGIDLYTNRREPVQVKKTRGGVGPGVLRDFRTALRSEGASKGYIVSFYDFSRGAIEEASRARNEGFDIELVKLEDIPKYFN